MLKKLEKLNLEKKGNNMNKEEIKAIEDLKEFINDNEVQNISIFTAKTLLNLIEKQQEKLERFNNELDLDYVDNNFVSKDKIRELIEELEDVLDLAECDKSFAKYKKELLKEEINDLKELLEEK
jgi:hypothetical protein